MEAGLGVKIEIKAKTEHSRGMEDLTTTMRTGEEAKTGSIPKTIEEIGTVSQRVETDSEIRAETKEETENIPKRLEKAQIMESSGLIKLKS